MNDNFGKVVKYDGKSGKIVDENGDKYIFLSTDIISKDLKSGDYVVFQKEIFKTLEIKKNVARFIKKIQIN